MDKVREITSEEVLDAMARGAVLVDLLPQEHFDKRHISGALNACVYEVTFVDTFSRLVPDRQTEVVVYGAGGGSNDWREAVNKLHRAGYESVCAYPGGIEGWLADGGQLEGESPDEDVLPHPVFTPEPRRYELVPQECSFQWAGRNAKGAHVGVLSLSSGHLDFSGQPAGEFVIDMRTLRNIDLEGDELQPVLEAHLASDDFFFTSLFPEVSFVLKELQVVTGDQATLPNRFLRGDLTMRGMEREAGFPAHMRQDEQGRIILQANFDFDRTSWGIIYGSSRFFRHLGMHLVYDMITVDFRLVLA